MTRKRYIAIHTFHSDRSKEAFHAWNSENPSTEEEFFEAWNFERCQCVASWVGDDDFFFCHWLADSDQDVHEALTSMGLDEFVFTACYEAHMYLDINQLPEHSPIKKSQVKASVDAS